MPGTKCSIFVNSFNPHSSTIELVVLLPSFYQVRTERSNNLPEITQLVSGCSWDLNTESPTPETVVLTVSPPLIFIFHFQVLGLLLPCSHS